MGPKKKGKRAEMTREEKEEFYKKQQQKQRAKQREERRETRGESNAAADAAAAQREHELRSVRAQLARRGMQLHEIQSDGNCLYRAAAHQLAQRGEEQGYAAIRKLCADELRANPSKYQPFVVDEQGDTVSAEAFERHCDAVEHSSEWGGHTELEALAQALRMPVVVLQAQGEQQEFGRGFAPPSEDDLVLVYHKHYHVLGEHYNSCRPALPEDSYP
eukprot:TRINITY_DN59890_c0_g1_i1.p2 TRINITY_DN59890_c0_g1~~TRINITY_DN59890_c0_g1_i1.p2  ORF type:complete len:217 (+),score=99.49 TRINITY_DN59890_c0_g1_i1:111-761(+)